MVVQRDYEILATYVNYIFDPEDEGKVWNFHQLKFLK